MPKRTSFILLISITALFFSCQRGFRPGSQATGGMPGLVVDVLLPTTPVKNQGKSPLCWNYAMLATIESNRLAVGDSVNLSPHYIAYCWLHDQVRNYYLTQGASGFTLTGMGSSLLRLMERHGAMPWDSFCPRREVDYIALMNRLQLLADAAIAHRDGLESLLGKATQILDEEIAAPPRRIHLLGADYTPHEFACSLCLPGDYRQLTSFAHHPFGQSFELEASDNVFHDRFENLPIDSLLAVVERSLRQGRAVCWEGDVTGEGFLASGIADCRPQSPPSQQSRQRELENFALADDHSLALVGLAHDDRGRLYFIAKNSWGAGAGNDGFWYLSEQYFRMATFAVIIPKE